MKKKILGGLLVVAIAAVAAFNVNMNTENDELSSLALANVEALAGEFNWDGKDWTTDGQWYNEIPGTSAWKPVITDCSIAMGMPPYVVTVVGRKVVCNYGSGNCFTSSSCAQS